MSSGTLRYEDRDSTTMKWVIIFVILSLLAHVVIVGVILLITHFLPPPKMHLLPTAPTSVKVTIVPPPPALAPPPKHIFIPTQPDAEAQHKEQIVESANDTNLRSKSQVARKPDSIMPDMTGQNHAPDLRTTPNVQAPPKPEVSSTPPTPRQATTPQKPTPPQTNPQHSTQTPRPPQPKATPTPPKPNPKPAPKLDPNTGLPVLPPINAPTLAPPNQASQALAPAPSQQQIEEDAHGAIGMAGDNSPAAMASELGKYKQYVHDVVGSYWYPDVDQHFSTLGVGVVHIQFTIHSDGTISDIKVLEDDKQEILKNISINALRAPAPYKAFTEGMIREVGDSYTDDFTFSVYGN